VELAAFVISLAAIAISGGALWWTRINALENKRRNDVDIARRHVTWRLEPREYLGQPEGSTWWLDITNVGTTVARRVDVLFLEDEKRLVTEDHEWAVIAPDETKRVTTNVAPLRFFHAMQSGRLQVTWRDEAGGEHRVEAEIPFHDAAHVTG
jgi:hypothetical protein